MTVTIVLDKTILDLGYAYIWLVAIMMVVGFIGAMMKR
jgi:hypothetical protein